MRKKSVGVLYTLAAAACWACAPLFSRYLYAGGVTAGAAASWRGFLSAFFMWILILIKGRSASSPVIPPAGGSHELDTARGIAFMEDWIPRARGMTGKRASSRFLDIVFFALYGFIGTTGLFLCFLGALSKVSVPQATAMLNTAPAFVILGSALFLRERITARKLAALILCLGGCMLVVGAYDPRSWSGAPAGLALGMGSGVCYAGLSLMGRAALRRLPAEKSLAWMFTLGSAWMFLFVRPHDMVASVTLWQHWALLGGLALFATVLPNLFFLRGVGILRPSTAALVVTAEPVISVCLAGVLFGEGLSMLQIFGMGAVLIGSVLPLLKRS